MTIRNGSRAQVSRFAAVGVSNTLIDYVLFIGLTKLLSIPLDWVWVAKLASGTVAIGNSFVLNRQWVFKGEGRIAREGTAFLTAALIGVYAVQTPVTHLFSAVFTAPGEAAFTLADRIGAVALVPQILTEPFAIKTVAFVVAGVATLTWNFLAYRYWVFGDVRLVRRRPRPETPDDRAAPKPADEHA